MTDDVANTLTLDNEYITLAQALKAADLADTGGQAKWIIRNGDVLVNGEVVTQPGKKLTAGDRFGLQGGDAWTIQ